MTGALLGIALSSLVTWLLTHIYYRRATRDLREIVDKLPSSFATKLAEEQRRKLTLAEFRS